MYRVRMYGETCIGWMSAAAQAEMCNVSGFLFFVSVEHQGVLHHSGVSPVFHTGGRQGARTLSVMKIEDNKKSLSAVYVHPCCCLHHICSNHTIGVQMVSWWAGWGEDVIPDPRLTTVRVYMHQTTTTSVFFLDNNNNNYRVRGKCTLCC